MSEMIWKALQAKPSMTSITIETGNRSYVGTIAEITPNMTIGAVLSTLTKPYWTLYTNTESIEEE